MDEGVIRRINVDALYFEAHVTIDTKYAEQARRIGQAYGFHWSQIDGDEVMGAGVRGYLTRSYPDGVMLKRLMIDVLRSLDLEKVPYQRYKLEAAFIDQRIGKRLDAAFSHREEGRP